MLDSHSWGLAGVNEIDPRLHLLATLFLHYSAVSALNGKVHMYKKTCYVEDTISGYKDMDKTTAGYV